MKPEVQITKMKVSAAAVAVIILSVLLYLPGLSGSFQFDDYPNLGILGQYGPIDSLQQLYLYLDEKLASSIGRPIAVLSFLAQSGSWTDSPENFLAVNIGLHALNAGLLFGIVFFALSHASHESLSRKSIRIALFATLLWACHPLLVSTTLYVVQRMTLLSSFFVFSGLLAFLNFRWRLHCASRISLKTGAGYAALIFLLAIAAILSKENGILLFPLILVFEYFLVRPLWRSEHNAFAGNDFSKRWLLAVAWLPTAGIALLFLTWYFAIPIISELASGSMDNTSKVLLQPLILIFYLYSLVLAQPSYAGLYYDGYPLTNPDMILPYGVLAISVLAAYIYAIYRYRTSQPLIWFAVLFFLVAISIESLHPGLEHIFEHRVYLPAAFLFVPIVAAISRIRLKQIQFGLLVLILIWFCGSTLARTNLWGQPYELSVRSAERNEYSLRAKLDAFYKGIRAGDFYTASRMMALAREQDPANPHVLLIQYELARKAPFLVEDRNSLVDRFMKARLTKRSDEVAEKLLQLAGTSRRFDIENESVLRILSSWLESMPRENSHREFLIRTHRLASALRAENYDLACDDLGYILPRARKIEHLIGTAVLFARNDANADALEILKFAAIENKNTSILAGLARTYYGEEIQILMGTISQDFHHRSEAPRCDYSTLHQSL